MSRITVNLFFNRREICSASRRQHIIVVIDVLRATSTMITALANGAECIVPAETLSEARDFYKRYPDHLLAGERRGVKPSGFHLGNSPMEFQREVVRRKTIILTTSSGTRTILAASASPNVLLAAFLNVEAAAEKAVQLAEAEGVGITIAPSGRKHSFSLEDFLCAGAIALRLERADVEFSDFTWGALLAFKSLGEPLGQAVWMCRHARELREQGFGEDVEFCSQLNLFRTVPVFKAGRILPA